MHFSFLFCSTQSANTTVNIVNYSEKTEVIILFVLEVLLGCMLWSGEWSCTSVLEALGSSVPFYIKYHTGYMCA